ncbi:hypothetical protein Tco_0672995 [Tanacetum coccineum]
MSEVKNTNHSADVLASIKSQVPTVVDKYLGTKLDDALLRILERHTADLIEKYSVLPGLESIKNQESEKSPKEIIRIKKEQGEEKQESTYSIRSTDKVALEEFNIKSNEDADDKEVFKDKTGTKPGRNERKKLCKADLEEHPSETKVFHNEDGNPARANIKQALGYLKDGDGDGNSHYERPHKGVKASANSDIVYFFTSAQDGDPLQDDLCVASRYQQHVLVSPGFVCFAFDFVCLTSPGFVWFCLVLPLSGFALVCLHLPKNLLSDMLLCLNLLNILSVVCRLSEFAVCLNESVAVCLNLLLFGSVSVRFWLLRENTDSVRSNQRMRSNRLLCSDYHEVEGWQLYEDTFNQFPLLSLFAIVAACAPRAAETLSATRAGSPPSGRVDLTGDEDPTDEDGDIRMGDSTLVSVSLGGGISSEGKKSQESNIDDGGKTVGGAIGVCGGEIGDSLLVASYACMTFIYGSSWKCEMASEAKRYLDKSSEGSGEAFPGEAGK